MDVVALVSVASSGAVALGGLWVTFRSGRDQREHESRLAFEERAWDQKSAGLFEVIAAARMVLDTLDDPRESGRERIVMVPEEVLPRLAEQVGVVEVYGSDECREAYDELVRWFEGFLRGPRASLVSIRVGQLREQKESAIDAAEFEEAARLRLQEREVMRESLPTLGSLDDLRDVARRLIDGTRDCMRGRG